MKNNDDLSMFINVNNYRDKNYPFQIFMGGRGIGKTYTGLRGQLGLDPVWTPETGDKFVYMRRTLTELEEIWGKGASENLNPFKSLNRDYDVSYGLFKTGKRSGGVFEREFVKDVYRPVGIPIGYAVALSVLAGMRSIDMSDCADIIYDEFCPEQHVKRIKAEADALFNAYESMARNREMLYGEPMNLWLFSNSDNIYNPVCIGLGIVRDMERMVMQGKEDRLYPDRGLAVHILKTPEEFKEKKSETALYKLTKGTKFYNMALNNEFAYNDFDDVRFKNVKEYRPLYKIDNFVIYRHKSNRKNYYVSFADANLPSDRTFKTGSLLKDRDLISHLYWFSECMVDGQVSYESIELKERLSELLF